MTRDVTAVTRDATLRSLAMLPVARSSREGRVGIAAVADPPRRNVLAPKRARPTAGAKLK